MFILRETLSALRRTPLMSAMTAFVIAIALAVIGVFGIIIIRAHDVLRDFRSTLTIEVFFDTNIASTEAQGIIDRDINHIPGVNQVTFVSREEALAEYEKQTGENPNDALGYNPLPASVQITMHDLHSTTARTVEQQLAQVRGVSKVIVDQASLQELEERQSGLITLAAGIGGLLLCAALVTIIATIRLAMHARRTAVRTMRLLGASRFSVIAPFIFEGGIAGVVGAILGIALAHAIVTYGLPMLMPEMDMTLSMRQEYLFLAGGIVLTGLTVALIGSTFTALALIRRTR